MATRIYVVGDKQGATQRLVRAGNQAQALRHVAKDRFEVKVADQNTLVFLMENGAKVETAETETVEQPA